MDQAEPSPPPSLHRPAAQPCAQPPFALGETPAWSLAACGDGLLLTIAGIAPLRLGPGMWRSSPTGRYLVATSPRGAVMMLRVDHGICREPKGQLVTLAIGTRTLRGCLLAGSERPYDDGL